jgi:protein O-mannosyl-transferase
LAAIQLRKSRPYVLAGWLWFIVTLIPVIGLVQVGSQARADRYTYIPLIGLFILITWLVSEPFIVRAPAPAASKKGKKRVETVAAARPNTGLTVAACAVVLIFTVCGFVQAGYWKNSETLWQNAIDATGRNPLAEKMLGEALEKEGRLDEAIVHYQNAVDIKPTFIEARNNLGAVLAREGRTDEAIQTYEEALKYAPAYSRSGRPNTAIVENNLAHQLVNAQRYTEAISHYQAALQSLPKSAPIHCDFGVALAYAGKPEEAFRELKESLRIAPKRAATYASLGLVYAMMNQPDNTIRESQQAVRLDPYCREAYNNMAVAFATKGNLAQAWKQLHLFEEHGGTLNPRFVQMLSSQMADPGR